MYEGLKDVGAQVTFKPRLGVGPGVGSHSTVIVKNINWLLSWTKKFK